MPIVPTQKITTLILILIIGLGIFLRFYLLSPLLNPDEEIISASALKFHHQSFIAGELYDVEHPPLGRWLIGLPSVLINGDYQKLQIFNENTYVFTYLAMDELKMNSLLLKFTTAVVGTLSIPIIYLISKDLYGRLAGILSAALLATSFDAVIFSRLIFMESYILFFTLASFYLILKYLKLHSFKITIRGIGEIANNTVVRLLIILSLAVSLTFMFGSRTLHPFLLLPVFLIFILLEKCSRRTKIVLVLTTILAFSIVYFVIYPPNMWTLSTQIKNNISTTIFSVNLFNVIESLIVRNSYLFLLALGLIALYPKSIYENKFILFYIIIFISFFAITKFGAETRYLFPMFIPFYIVGGKNMAKFSQDFKYGLLIVLSVAVLSAALLLVYSPNFENYSNFGVKNQVIPYSDTLKIYQNTTQYLNSIGNPNVITNVANLWIGGYSGRIFILLPPVTNCDLVLKNQSFAGFYIVYRPTTADRSFFSDTHKCSSYNNFNLALEADTGIQVMKIVGMK